MKTITLDQIITPLEFKRCIDLYYATPDHEFARVVCEQVIRPALSRINQITGQENDPMYWAYAVQFVLNKSKHPDRRPGDRSMQ